MTATLIVAAVAVGTVLSYLTWLGWKEARENDRRRAALAAERWDHLTVPDFVPDEWVTK